MICIRHLVRATIVGPFLMMTMVVFLCAGTSEGDLSSKDRAAIID